jgi:hypothetical protein
MTASPSTTSNAGTPGSLSVAIFKGFTLFTLATGLCLHGSSLFIGREQFVATVFTPTFDAIFAVPMTIAGIAAAWVYRRAIFAAAWQKWVYWFLLAYFGLSILIHLRTLFTWDTSYVLAFPAFYPFVAMTLMLLLGIFTVRQRFSPARAT